MEVSPQIVHWMTRLRVNRFRGEPRPLKPVLLLAVIELAEAGRLAENEVHFGPPLFEAFAEYWRAVSDDPVGRVQYPFWHMDTAFWTLIPHAGFESRMSNKSSSPSARQVREWVLYARLDDSLFEALQDATLRDRLRGILVSTHFPERAGRIAEVRDFEQSVYQYTQLIRRVGEAGAAYRATPEYVRDAAFRRVVTEAYGYTCAVSRDRLTLAAGGGTYQLVQAAHIRDWADSHDDSPQNGLALSANYHWLFERGLFTIDERWRVTVSPVARDCIGNVDALLSRHRGRPILLPADDQLRPSQDYLDWHRATKYLAG